MQGLWQLGLYLRSHCCSVLNTTYRTLVLFTLFLGVIFFLSFSRPSVVKAQTPTLPPQALFPTATPIPEGYYDCPVTPPQGWGTATPSSIWNMRCGHCKFENVEQVTPTIGVTPTPNSNCGYVYRLGEVQISASSCGQYWCPVFVNVPNEQIWVNANVRIIRLSQSGAADGQFNYYNDPTGALGSWFKPGFSCDINTAYAQLPSPKNVYRPQNSSAGFASGSTYVNFNPGGNPAKIEFWVASGVPPVLNREYVVTFNSELTKGKVMIGCSEGDVPIGALVGVAVQGGGIVSNQSAYTKLVDTGYAPLLEANVSCSSFDCSGSDYEVSGVSSQYPYARVSQALITSPLIVQWERSKTLNGVHNVNLHCYGTGNGYINNLDSYCSIVEASSSPIDFGLNPVYQDRGCVSVDPIAVGDFSTPGFNICARVITFGELNLFGIVINLDLIARFMMVVAALFLVLR